MRFAVTAVLMALSAVAAGCWDDADDYAYEYGVDAELLSRCVHAPDGRLDIVVERHRNGNQHVFLSGSYSPGTAEMLYGDLTEDLTSPDRPGDFRGALSIAVLCHHDPSVWLRYSDGRWVPSP